MTLISSSTRQECKTNDKRLSVICALLHQISVVENLDELEDAIDSTEFLEHWEEQIHSEEEEIFAIREELDRDLAYDYLEPDDVHTLADRSHELKEINGLHK